jgi:hypothetical protein
MPKIKSLKGIKLGALYKTKQNKTINNRGRKDDAMICMN